MSPVVLIYSQITRWKGFVAVLWNDLQRTNVQRIHICVLQQKRASHVACLVKHRLNLPLAVVTCLLMASAAGAQGVPPGNAAPRAPIFDSPGIAPGAPVGPQTAPYRPTTPPPVATQVPAGRPPVTAPPQNVGPQLIEGGQVIARIGSEIVTADEILGRINLIIKENRDKIPDEQVDQARNALMQRELAGLIETKMLVAAARAKIPAENFPNIEKQVEKRFNELRLPKLYESTGTNNPRDLSAALATQGTTLAILKRQFLDRALATQWLQQQVQEEYVVSHNEILDYYRRNIKDYEFDAKARWEELAVRFDRFNNKAEAYQALALMGNEVFRTGQFAEVAKNRSQAISASRGGKHDWTTRGGLKSETLNRALFTLPVGQMSQIIESEIGFHIVRVIERRDSGKTAFVDAQVDIREALKKEKRQADVKKYLETVRKETHIWTAFDAGTPDPPRVVDRYQPSRSR